MKSTQSEFRGWRRTMFPIHGHELSKLLPMFLMSFFTCFNQSLLRNLKDALVITADSSGAEVIPFIKLWGILPAAILATSLFTWLSNRFSRPQVFNILISGFIGYFTFFAFVIYPMRDQLQPNQFCDWLQLVLPQGMMGLVSMIRHWSLSLFFIIAELWGTVVLGILFWGFANEITKVSEARRFYGVLGFGSNFAAIAAGRWGMFLSLQEKIDFLPIGQTAWEQGLMLLLLSAIVGGVIILTLYRWMVREVLAHESKRDDEPKKEKKKKPKMGFFESLAFIKSNSYLRNLAFMVVAYNLVINLVEVIWKGELKTLYPEAVDYNHFVNMVTMVVGIFSCMTALFMSSIIRRLGWTSTAMIAPLILLVTSIGFFGSMYLPMGALGGIMALMGIGSPLVLVVFFGAAQNCLSKAAKYSVFDTTKEIALIPLDSTLKLRGKAAIDGIGSRFGKSGSSLIQQGLLLAFGSLSATIPVVAIILGGVVSVWLYSIRSVGRSFDDLMSRAEANESASEESPSSSSAPLEESAATQKQAS